MEQQVIRLRQVVEICQISESTVRRQERAGRFPARVRLAPNSVGWRLSEVQAWLQQLQLVAPVAGEEP